MKSMLHQGKTLLLKEEVYPGNYRTAIQVLTLDKKYLCDLTINLPDQQLNTGEFCVPQTQKLSGLFHSARESGLFINTGRRIELDGQYIEVWCWDTTPRE